jgi:hypothetical protein
MGAGDQPGLGWTVVLGSQPARMIEGKAESGYTGLFEIFCCDCGGDRGLDYREVPPVPADPRPLPAQVRRRRLHPPAATPQAGARRRSALAIYPSNASTPGQAIDGCAGTYADGPA